MHTWMRRPMSRSTRPSTPRRLRGPPSHPYYPFDGDTTDLAYAPGAFACTSCSYQAGHRGMAVLISTEPLPDRPVASADFTIAGWVYVPSLYPGNIAGCPTFLTAAGTLESDDEPARVMLYGFNYSPASSGLVNVNADDWTHVAMTYVAATGATRLFVNAVDRNGTTATIADSLDDVSLSAGTCGVMIDELFMFDRVLTPVELATVRDL